MLIPLVIGCLIIVANMAIQVATLLLVILFLIRKIKSGQSYLGFYGDFRVVGIVLAFIFGGNLLQIATWAVVFMLIGQFSDFATAFYHSMVNFASLGYGDIVMDPPWRLLGALEAANGVLMFGLTAGAILSVMNYLIRRHDFGLPASLQPATKNDTSDPDLGNDERK